MTTPEDVMATPPIDLEEMYEQMGNSERWNATYKLDDIAQAAVLRTEYISMRLHGQDHKGAAKAAMKRLNKVRKAMGYNVPLTFSF